MDKQTRWLRVEVPTRLYDEIVRLAKLDDREPHVFLRRHLEDYFCQPTCKCGPDGCCLECVDYTYRGTAIRADGPTEKYQVVTETPCLHDGKTGPMSIVCPCPKCAAVSAAPGLTGESVHGTPTLASYEKSSCEGGGHVGPCGMNDCTHCNPPTFGG